MIYERVDFDKPLDESTVDKEDFENATHCHICERKLRHDKVLDHCHFPGKYRGAAHNKCNLHFRLRRHIPVFFHNLAGYDSHLFIKSLHIILGKIDYIPNNEESFISFSKETKMVRILS